MNVEGHNWSDAASAADVATLLRALRRRGWILVGLRGMAWLLVALAVMLTAFVTAIGWFGGAGLRAFGWSVVSVGAAAVLAFGILRPLLRIASLEAVAREVGSRFPRLASDVLSAYQLARPGAGAVFSRALLERHLREVAAALLRIAPFEVFPRRSLLYPLAALVVAAAGIGAVVRLAPGLVGTGLRSVFEDPHVPGSMVVEAAARSPVVGDLSIVLRYPEYLGRPDRRLSDTSGALVAPLGTIAVVEGRSLVVEADHGVIRLPGQRTAPLSLAGGERVTGSFVVEAAGAFSFAIGAEDHLVEGPTRTIEVEEDSAPTVRLLRPTGEVVVDESGEVVLEFEAMDDHGISRVDLVASPRKGAPSRRTVMRVADDVGRLESKYSWAPAGSRADTGGQVRLELEVFDNDTITGPKSGRSRTVEVQVMTRLSRHEAVLAEQERTLDALIDLLAARLEAPVAAQQLGDEEAKKRFAVLRGQTEDLLGRTAGLLHQVGLDPLTPRSVEDTFLRIREDLSGQLIHESRLYRAPVASATKRQAVDRVTVRLLEEAVLRVDDLVLDQRFSRLVADGDRLEEGRRELARLMEGFAGTRAESARRAVLEAISRLEKSVSDLSGVLAGVRGEVGDEYVNAGAVQMVDLLGALARMRALLASDDVEGALALAADMERMVAMLMTGLESGHLSFRTARFGEGDRFIGDLLDRLMAIESDQLQLRRKTTALRRRYQEKLLEVMKGRIDPLVKRQLRRVLDMRNRLAEAAVPGDVASREALVATRVQVRELELALGQGELDEARRIAGDLAQEDDPRDEGEPKPLAVTLRSVSKAAKTIAREIDDEFPKAAQLFGDRDRADSRAQAATQRHLAAKTRKLRAWIGEQGDETRFLAHQALAELDHVANSMTRGVSHLEERNVKEALEAQAEALEALERLRRDLRRGNEPARVESRPIVLKGDVSIPAPEDYEVPAEFRKDILEAMRGALPGDYREAIERYYETLVR